MTVVDTAGHWLVCGCDDGNLLVTDLDAATSNPAKTLPQKYKHSGMSFLDDKYRGITSIHCMPTHVNHFDSGGNGDSTGQLVFSGCSKGMIKAWLLHDKYSGVSGHDPQMQPSQPNQQTGGPYSTPVGGNYVGSNGAVASSSSWSIAMKMRMKQSLTVVKAHSNPISALLAQPYHLPEGAAGDDVGWLLYSGDSVGTVAISRGSEISSSSSSSGANVVPVDNDFGSVGGISSLTLLGGGSSGGASQQPFNTSPSASYWKSPPSGGNRRFSYFNDILVVGTSAGIVSALDVSTATPVFYCRGHKEKVVQVAGLRSNQFLSCSLDRTIKLWDIRMKSRSSVISIGGSSGIQPWGCKNLGSSTFQKVSMIVD